MRKPRRKVATCYLIAFSQSRSVYLIPIVQEELSFDEQVCHNAFRLIRPIVEQPVYSLLLDRSKVEFEFADLYKKYKFGLTVWSPLAYGILTGKYSASTPEGSRMASNLYKAFTPDFAERVAKADKLQAVADELGISMTELALAWCVSNENVSSRHCRPSWLVLRRCHSSSRT